MTSLRRCAPYVVILAASAAGCASQPPSSRTAAPDASAPIPVDVVRVTSAPLRASQQLPGELRPYEIVPMFSKVAGFVRSIDVDRGSVVRERQIVIRLDAPELLAQRAEAQAKQQSAQAQLAAAQAKLASDEGTLKRLEAASATPGAVAGNDLEIAQQSVEADRAQLAAQRDTVGAATQALQALAEVAGYLDVRAPFDGIVTERNVHPGALVGPGSASPMITIERLSRLRLVVPVPESFVAGLRAGQTVEFSVPAYPGRTFTGTLARLARSVDVRTRTMPVEADVANGAGELTPGTFVEVRWPIDRPTPSLFVPSSSVTSTLERTFVVRIRDGKAEWVDVKTGVTMGRQIEVFGDLRENDQIVVRGTDELRPGTAVTARPAVPAS